MFRFTPTPSGYLHIGNAFNFVLTWLIAREKQVDVLLRIDDLDATRRRDEYVEDIFRSIDALGLSYDKGPSGPDDFFAQWSQHHRMGLYDAALEKLASASDLVYGCKLSRKEINALKKEGQYPSSARKQAVDLTDAETAWRIKSEGEIHFQDMDKSAYAVNLEGEMPDFVIRRKDGLPAYQIASLADDQHFGISGIVRGKDLVASTAAQIWLAEKLEYKEFADLTLLHHPLFKGAQHEKLSKSAGALSLKQMLEKPEQIWRWIAQGMNLPACSSLTELQSAFSFNNLSLSSIEITS
jgi:glutamyl-tRNA synthetase